MTPLDLILIGSVLTIWCTELQHKPAVRCPDPKRIDADVTLIHVDPTRRN